MKNNARVKIKTSTPAPGARAGTLAGVLFVLDKLENRVEPVHLIFQESNPEQAYALAGSLAAACAESNSASRIVCSLKGPQSRQSEQAVGLRYAPAKGFHTRSKPNPWKSLTLVVANSVTPW
jgi:hypothetical protein